jgi:hypothetical protein
MNEHTITKFLQYIHEFLTYKLTLSFSQPMGLGLYNNIILYVHRFNPFNYPICFRVRSDCTCNLVTRRTSTNSYRCINERIYMNINFLYNVSTKVLFIFLKIYYMITNEELCSLFESFVSSKALCVLFRCHMGTLSGPSDIKLKVQFCLCAPLQSFIYTVRILSYITRN